MPTGWIEIVGPERSLRVLGVKLLGVNAVTGNKLLLTLGLVVLIWLLVRLLGGIARLALRGRSDVRARFWSHQAIHLIATVLFLLVAVSIWFDRPTRFAASAGLITAGIAVALQRVITAVAAYFVILRGRVFNVGDRIAMAGVRGDVIALGYTRTTIMEMGQPPPVQDDEPAMWVEARQYTGRIVTVTNDKIFDEPVYNYSRVLPFIWEEIKVPVPHGVEVARAEAILLDAARRHTSHWQPGEAELGELRRRYGIVSLDDWPRVYVRITDDWLELTVRFLVSDHGVRAVKDAVSRDILRELAAAGIGIASATIAIVQAPPIRIAGEPRPAERAPDAS